MGLVRRIFKSASGGWARGWAAGRAFEAASKRMASARNVFKSAGKPAVRCQGKMPQKLRYPNPGILTFPSLTGS